MRIIITGATGLVGRALARELLSRGHEVEAWTRSPDVSGPRLPPGCTVVGWHPERIDPRSIAGADAVLHLAGENVAAGRWTKARKNALHSSRVDVTEALVRAIADLPDSERPASLITASEKASRGPTIQPGLAVAADFAVRSAATADPSDRLPNPFLTNS